MSKPELTKAFIAQTLRNLIKETSLDKISIQTIANACEINRKTFYYHFKDKQELICWIFDSDLSKFTGKYKGDALINEIIRYMYENKDFYIAALTSETQNNLREHLFKLCFNECKEEIMSLLGSREMTSKKIDLLAIYFSNAIIGCLVQWSQQGMRADPDEYEMDFPPITRECLKFVVDKYVNNK